MKIIKNSVISKTEPSTDVLWIDPKDNNKQKVFIDGKWSSVDSDLIQTNDINTLSVDNVSDDKLIVDKSDNALYRKNDNGEFCKVGGKDFVQPIIYSELKQLRDNSLLIPGMQYRITDYRACVYLFRMSVIAPQQFDIIVTADDVNVLNENASAIEHDGENYFSNSNLKAWKLKYTIDECVKGLDDYMSVKEEEYCFSTNQYDSNTLGSIANIPFFKQDDYFEVSIPYFPRLHNGVEESMYIEHVKLYDKNGDETYNPKEAVVIRDYKTLEETKFKVLSIYYSKTPYKGHIYYMKDEFNNEANYDFKTILGYTHENPLGYTTGRYYEVIARDECGCVSEYDYVTSITDYDDNKYHYFGKVNSLIKNAWFTSYNYLFETFQDGDIKDYSLSGFCKNNKIDVGCDECFFQNVFFAFNNGDSDKKCSFYGNHICRDNTYMYPSNHTDNVILADGEYNLIYNNYISASFCLFLRGHDNIILDRCCCLGELNRLSSCCIENSIIKTPVNIVGIDPVRNIFVDTKSNKTINITNLKEENTDHLSDNNKRLVVFYGNGYAFDEDILKDDDPELRQSVACYNISLINYKDYNYNDSVLYYYDPLGKIKPFVSNNDFAADVMYMPKNAIQSLVNKKIIAAPQ